MCYLLVDASYFIGLEKSQSIPLTCVRFLGFVCDSVRQTLVIPRDKRIVFQRFVLPISNHWAIYEYLREIVVARYKVPMFYTDLFKVWSSRVESGDERNNFLGNFRFAF